LLISLIKLLIRGFLDSLTVPPYKPVRVFPAVFHGHPLKNYT